MTKLRISSWRSYVLYLEIGQEKEFGSRVSGSWSFCPLEEESTSVSVSWRSPARSGAVGPGGAQARWSSSAGGPVPGLLDGDSWPLVKAGSKGAWWCTRGMVLGIVAWCAGALACQLGAGGLVPERASM